MEVNIYSRKAIEKLLQSNFPKNVAVISFYDPVNRRTGERDKPVNYSLKTGRVFPVAIHDIDLEILPKYGLTYDTYFPEADNLAEFIYSAYNEGLDIICQCEYGQSRSAACASAILEHFYQNGISVFADYRYYPNQMVFHKVFDALNSLKNAEQKESSATGKNRVGIWWYTDNNEIWEESIQKDNGILSGIYIQYSNTESHLSLWSSTVKKHIKDKKLQENIIAKGYKSVERGRVIYNTATMMYEITCSAKMIHNMEFRKNIVNYYQLSENRYEFVQLNHYYKIELTGNPILDEFIEKSQV